MQTTLPCMVRQQSKISSLKYDTLDCRRRREPLLTSQFNTMMATPNVDVFNGMLVSSSRHLTSATYTHVPPQPVCHSVTLGIISCRCGCSHVCVTAPQCHHIPPPPAPDSEQQSKLGMKKGSRHQQIGGFGPVGVTSSGPPGEGGPL